MHVCGVWLFAFVCLDFVVTMWSEICMFSTMALLVPCFGHVWISDNGIRSIDVIGRKI